MLYKKPLKVFKEFSDSQSIDEYFKQYLLTLNASQELTIPYDAIKDDACSQLNWWDTVRRLAFDDNSQKRKNYDKEKQGKMQGILEAILQNFENELD